MRSGFSILLFSGSVFAITPIALAEILATDDLESISGPENDSSSPTPTPKDLFPEISVQFGFGKSHLPYGPPGVEKYQANMRVSGFTLGLDKLFNSTALVHLWRSGFTFRNQFPSSGRMFDLQAVTWQDIELKQAAVGTLQVLNDFGIRWLIGFDAVYERFLYPKGTFSIVGLPLRAGATLAGNSLVFFNSFRCALDVQFSEMMLGKTLVKYGRTPTASGTSVQIEPLDRVAGSEMTLGIDVAFSTSRPFSRQEQSYPWFHEQHQISFVWQKKHRSAEGFISKLDNAGRLQESSPLDFSQSTYSLKWTERF